MTTPALDTKPDSYWRELAKQWREDHPGFDTPRIPFSRMCGQSPATRSTGTPGWKEYKK